MRYGIARRLDVWDRENRAHASLGLLDSDRGRIPEHLHHGGIASGLCRGSRVTTSLEGKCVRKHGEKHCAPERDDRRKRQR